MSFVVAANTLFATDGTAEGTQRWIDPAVDGTPVVAYPLAMLGSSVYFAASGPAGIELWRTTPEELLTTGFED